jgi:VCBS repeat-containing protein
MSTTDEDTLLIVGADGLLANDRDAEGDALAAVLVEAPAHARSRSTPAAPSATPRAFHGTDRFTYRDRAGGADGNVATVTITVRSVNDVPAALGDAYRTDEDTPLLVAGPGVLLNDTDRDGDHLTAILMDGPAHGRLTLDVNGAFRYTPDADFHGADQFRYKVHDGTTESAAVVVALTVDTRNDAPTVANHVLTLDEDTSLTVIAPGLLDGAADTEGDPLRMVLVRGPLHGTLDWNANGSFTCSPHPN